MPVPPMNVSESAMTEPIGRGSESSEGRVIAEGRMPNEMKYVGRGRADLVLRKVCAAVIA
jgi:hypothetical protein